MSYGGHSQDDGGQRAQRIRRVVREYYRRLAAGDLVSEEAIIKAYPELMPELAKELATVRLVEQARIQAGEEEADRSGWTTAGQQGRSTGLQIRCPFCHTPVQSDADASFTDIECSACGNRFSLVEDEFEAKDASEAARVGRFELLEKLGLGGFGTVWKARDTELDRTVAMKIPRKGQLTSTEIDRFLREARTAAQLKHPNIVGVHEAGRDGDTIYIVADLVDGVPLSDRLAHRRTSVREGAELCRKIADALDHAHEQGIVHRDLKPQNVMIDADGEPQLTDFGLARREAGEITMTMDGHVLGTPAYMSPEQAKGQAHKADRRSDIYALGVILFETLTGELPFRGNLRTLIHQVIHDEAPSPRRFNSSIPRDLETVCLKCLEKEPRKRYASAKELAEELRRFLGREPIKARPITAPGRFWRWCKRNPALSSLAGVLVVTLLAGLMGVTWQWIRAEEQAERRRRLLYVSDINGALQAWEDGKVEQVIELLKRHAPAVNQKDLRGFEWYYLWRLCQRSLAAPTFEHTDRVWSVAFSPDSKSLASACRRTVTLWDVASGKQVREFNTGTQWGAHVAFSPDGRMLASSAGGYAVKLWDLTTDEEPLTLEGHSQPVWCVAFSPDGKTLASSGEDSTPRLWDAVTGELKHLLEGHMPLPVFCVAFSPDGKMLASGGGDFTVRLWDVATGQQLKTLAGHENWLRSLAFSPDGNTLASGSDDNTVKLWDMATGNERATLRGHTSPVSSLAISPDSETLASASWDRIIKLWDVSTQQELGEIRGHGASCVAFSPDGMKLASGGDTTVKLWQVATDDESVVLKGHQNWVFSVSFAPDGKTLASGSVDGTVKLWDLLTGEARATIGYGSTCVAFSPDGNTLACASGDGAVRLCDLVADREPSTLQGHKEGVWAVAFSPAGDTLASGSRDTTVKLWDAASGRPKHALLGHSDWVLCVAYSPDGKTLASGSADKTVKLWDVATGDELDTLKGHKESIRTLAFSSDGKTLATGSEDMTAKLWYLGVNKSPKTLTGHGTAVFSLALSPDGETLATGGAESEIKLWDVASGEQRATLRGHTGPVNALAFSADGNTLASGSSDKTVRLWRRATQEKVRAAGW